MKPVLHIYTRVSSAIQEEEGTSLQTQEEQGIKKAAELDFDHKIWNEGGKSSKFEDLENRPILKRLLVEIENGNVDHLFVFNTDRLSRNQKTWGGIRWRLKEQGVKLHTPSGVIDLSSPMDDLIIGILSEISQYDNALRAERSRLGKLNKIRQGFWMGGPPPFGYMIEERKLVENPDESQWVRQIYQWYTKGKSPQFIKHELDTNGVKTRRGKLWSLGSIQKILRNTQYIGYYTYRNKKLDETVECSCPAFLDPKLWHAAQARREHTKERKGQNNRTERFYLLRNLMYCGHCGTPMAGRIKPSKNERLYYCPNKERSWVKNQPKDEEKWDRNRGCQMKRSLNIPRTDSIVWKAVIDVLTDSKHLQRKIEEKYGTEQALKADLAKERKRETGLKRRLEKVEESLAQIAVNQILEDMDQQSFETLQGKLNEEKQSITEKLEQSRDRAKSMADREKWMDAVSRIRFHIGNMEKKSEEEKRHFLELFITRIDVKFDAEDKTHELVLNFRLPLIDKPIDEDVLEGISPYLLGLKLPPLKATPQLPIWRGCVVGQRPCP